MYDDALDKDIKALLAGMLDWNPKTRFDIDQVVNSRAIQKYKSKFNEPITADEYELLIKNFLMNSPTGLTNDTPQEVLKYACFELPRDDWINLQDSFQNTGFILNKKKDNFEAFQTFQAGSRDSPNGQTFRNLQEFGRGQPAKVSDGSWNDFMPPMMTPEAPSRSFSGSPLEPMTKQPSFQKQQDNQNKKVIKIDNGGDNLWASQKGKEAPKPDVPVQSGGLNQQAGLTRQVSQGQSQPQAQAQPQSPYQSQAQAQAQQSSWSQVQSQSLVQGPSQTLNLAQSSTQVAHQIPQPPQSPTLWKTPYAPNLPRHHFGFFEAQNNQDKSASATPSTPFNNKDLEPKVKKAPNSEPPASLNPFMAEVSPRNDLTVSQASRVANDQNWDMSQAFKKVQKLETPEPKRYDLNKPLDLYITPASAQGQTKAQAPAQSQPQAQAQPKPQAQPQAQAQPQSQPKTPESSVSGSSGVKVIKRVYASGSFLQSSSSQASQNQWESTSARHSPKRQLFIDGHTDVSVKETSSHMSAISVSSKSETSSVNTAGTEPLNLTGLGSPLQIGTNRLKIDIDHKLDLSQTVGMMKSPTDNAKPAGINRANTSTGQPTVFKNGVLVTKNGEPAANGRLLADIQVPESNKPRSDELLQPKHNLDLFSSSVQSLEQYASRLQERSQQQSKPLLGRFDAPSFVQPPQPSTGSLHDDIVSPARSPANEESKKQNNKTFKINLSIHGQQRDNHVATSNVDAKQAKAPEPAKQAGFQVGGSSMSSGQSKPAEAPAPERNGNVKSNVKHFKIG